MINLHTLKLDGWLSYDKAVIKLDEPGITWIKGKLGAGKSAILEAIFYLLFGKTLRKKSTVNNLVNKVLKRGYDISLVFSVDDVKYKVREIRERPRSGLYFRREDGTKLRGKTDPDTRKRIVETLGMAADDFRSIAFLGQRQTQLLVDGDEADRARALVDIFGLKRYDTLLETCEADVKNTTNEKKEFTETLEQSEQEFEHLEQSLLDEPSADVPDPKDLAKVDQTIKSTEETIEKIRDKADEINKIIGRATALDRQRDHIEKIKNQIADLKKELAAIKKPQTDQSSLERELDRLTRLHADAENKLRDLREKIANAKELKNTCPITAKDCPVNVPVKHSKKTFVRCKQERDLAKTDLEKLSCSLSDVQKACTIAREYNDTKYSLEAKEDLIKTFKLDGAIPSLAEKNKELDKYRGLISTGTAKLNQLLKRRSDIQTAIAVAQEKQALRDKVNNALEEKERAIAALKKQITKKTIDIQYLAGALAVFKKMKMYKIDLVLQFLNMHMKEILEKISDGVYRAEFVSQKRTADKKRTLDKIGILVYDSYKVLPIELCSGGQSTEVGLSVLLSVWKTANSISQKGVSSLWLDEVFGTLDEEIINRVFDSVIDIIKSMGTISVKIISHQELDSRLFDHFWNVSLTDGISNIRTKG